MIVSRRWLEALLGRPLDVRALEASLARLGVPVEAIVPLHQDLRDVLVARVLSVRRHPDADRLSLCTVDAGDADGPVEVVCGAPNVQADKVYPYAPVGATLPGGLKLERRKIRGVVSNGMLCSAKELGLGDDHAGILELDTTAAPGTPFLDAVPLDDDQLTLEITANRPDLLGHKGVARELAAALGDGVTIKLPEIPGGKAVGRFDLPPNRRTAGRGVVDGVEVRLEDPEGAPRYMIAVIRGIKVGPSPAWLSQRLSAAGQRPINNVVDATNYILLELNQPLHAFDLAKLRGPAVVVRRAEPGERIVTLDGVPRTLTADMTAICDAERPTIVAGVMGSAESEVSAATSDLVLECAYFQPTRIRRTRRALGISSESSYRYERGIDLLAMPDAMRRAIELIVAVAGGEVREAPVDLWPVPEQPRAVFLRPARVAHLLGVDVPRTEIERHLASVGFVPAPKDDRLAVQIPGWRPDVTREVDLIEEVARLRGYDSFPDELRPYRPGTVPDSPVEQAKDRVRATLARAGFLEARTLSLGPADGPATEVVAVRNPLSEEDAFLRSRLLPGLARRVQHNWAGGVRDVRLFEVGTVFHPGPGGGHAPLETIRVAGILTGARRPGHWSDGGGPGGAKVPDMDIWDLKYHFELATAVATPGAVVHPAGSGGAWEAVAPDGRIIGSASTIEVDQPKWGAPVYGYEVDLAASPAAVARFQPLPTTPPVVLDLALVLPAGVTAGAVAARFREAAGPLLERLDVFDEYRGDKIPAGTRSVAWHCAFRDPARTLAQKEVDRLVATALRALEDEFDVRRREG